MKWLSDEMLPVGDGHELCVRSWGRADGVPVVYLHGGPGSGTQEAHMRLFDRKACRVVAFDQRGAGASRPRGSREANTTPHLVADIERLREHFGIDRWLVVGGSWGATLALAYAQAHPERVSGLVLRAVFLGSRAELDWAFGTGLATMYPGLYADFLSMLPEGERGDPLAAYWRRILDPDPRVHLPFARAWGDTERVLSVLSARSARLDLEGVKAAGGRAPSSPFMEAHYFSNGCFLERPLMEGAGRLAGIPGALVQGRFDMLCPPATSHALAEAWPDAKVRLVEAAGHALEHEGVWAAMQEEVAAMVARLRAAETA